jgi:hypothetical protein
MLGSSRARVARSQLPGSNRLDNGVCIDAGKAELLLGRRRAGHAAYCESAHRRCSDAVEGLGHRIGQAALGMMILHHQQAPRALARRFAQRRAIDRFDGIQVDDPRHHVART